MDINIEGIVLIVGNYGSGKTEISINLAIQKKKEGMDVRVADLDLVNPYFRTREAKNHLSDRGIDLVLPDDMYLHADLPILNPAVSGMIRQPSQLTIIDVGGNDVGATVLAALGDALKEKKLRMLQVVNPYRPFTTTLEGCTKIKERIEKASKVSINGVIGNANLIEETTLEDLYVGYDFVRSFCKESGLPLEFVTAPEELMSSLDVNLFSCPVLPISRKLVPPWKKISV